MASEVDNPSASKKPRLSLSLKRKSASKKPRPPLSLKTNRKEPTSSSIFTVASEPTSSSRFALASDADVEKTAKGVVPDNTVRSNAWARRNVEE